MTLFRIRQASELVGLSDDTLRRWADTGRLRTVADACGRWAVDGAVPARVAEGLAAAQSRARGMRITGESSRNRFTGLVPRSPGTG